MMISVSVLTAGAESVVSQVGILTGYKESASGSLQPVFAKFKLVGIHKTMADVLAQLRKLGDATVNLNVPPVDDGILRIKLKPIYRAVALAELIERHTVEQPSEPPAPTGNGRIPAEVFAS